MQERILIIEDEAKLARFVELELSYKGYQVDKAPDGRTGLALAQSGGYDLIALDIMLPDLNGLEVLRRIRQSKSVPIILLTARDDVLDKVAGLDGGANDYITRPFAIEELLARIRAVLRSHRQQIDRGEAMDIFQWGPLSLNPQSRQVLVRESLLNLTKKEFDLLHILLVNKGRVLSREHLLDKVWGYDFPGDTNAVDVYIRYLRAKIEEPYGIKLIQTVRGVGYVIRD